ncbi:MAG: B12-binding domain-containing radical SAM protein [Candidatus Hodarchaeales archaeon]|jgi:radical SAM superfamily enzyme YgiQ (UPF0313 family)
MRKPRIKEINVILKSNRFVQRRIGLVYPNSYSVGMSGFTIKLMYHLLNKHPNIYTERIFLSPNSTIPPTSLESGKNLSQFDILAFTFQFELDYVNAIKMLNLSKIPIYAKERKHDHPILLAGGPAITANPEPLSEIFDIFFFGEFETVSNSFQNSIISNKHREILDTILTIPGFIPAQENHDKLSPVITQNLDNVDYPLAQVRPETGRSTKKLAFNGFFLQISRGCTHTCQFCLIRKIFRPYRERSLAQLRSLIDLGTEQSQTNFINLIGSSTADHSHIIQILNYVQEKKLRFALPSIRIDSGEEILEVIKNAGQRNLSIAPESGSDDIRFKLGKKISNVQIDSFIQKAQKFSIHQLKLYFILGLTINPVVEAQEILKMIESLLDSYPFMKFNLSVNPLVPKRGTYLENHRTNFHEIEHGLDILKHDLKNKVKYKSFPLRWAAIQSILSIGGRELAPKLIKVAQNGGSYQSWKKILGKDPIDYYTTNYRSK